MVIGDWVWRADGRWAFAATPLTAGSVYDEWVGPSGRIVGFLKGNRQSDRLLAAEVARRRCDGSWAGTVLPLGSLGGRKRRMDASGKGLAPDASKRPEAAAFGTGPGVDGPIKTDFPLFIKQYCEVASCVVTGVG